MIPREFQWKDVAYRGAVVPLVRERGRPDIAHAVSYFDDDHRILWVRIWWAPGTPDYEKPLVLERCTAALREWRGLGGYEPRIVAARRAAPEKI